MALVGLAACRTPAQPAATVGDPAAAQSVVCPAEAPAPPTLPFERPEHRVAELWLAKAQALAGSDAPGVDEPLAAAEEIAAHNERVAGLRHEGWPTGRWDLLRRPLDHRRLGERLRKQLARLREGLAAKRLRLGRGARPTLLAQTAQRMLQAEPTDELRVAHRSTPLRCMPTGQAVYEDLWIYPFDLLQCSQLRTGEAVRVVRKAQGYWLAWTSYGEGWVDPQALTPPLSYEQAERYVEPRRFAVVGQDQQPLFHARDGSLLAVVRLGLRLPVLGQEGGRLRVLAPGPAGLVEAALPAGRAAPEGFLQLTRSALFQLAFGLLDSPYGWGGMGDHRDCSRMLMDLFAAFGVQLPRNSGQQALAGMRTIDVEQLADADKARAIEDAARRGIVLLYLPGHIMLYVGRDGDQLFALHQFSGYLAPCSGGGETMYRVNRAAVTSLELGRGSSRRAFLQRIVRLVLFGPAAGPDSAAVDAGRAAPSADH